LVSDWSSDVCSSDLGLGAAGRHEPDRGDPVDLRDLHCAGQCAGEHVHGLADRAYFLSTGAAPGL